eukprot:6216869-Alexandrium_andersonii.AAC.1
MRCGVQAVANASRVMVVAHCLSPSAWARPCVVGGRRAEAWRSVTVLTRHLRGTRHGWRVAHSASGEQADLCALPQQKHALAAQSMRP